VEESGARSSETFRRVQEVTMAEAGARRYLGLRILGHDALTSRAVKAAMAGSSLSLTRSQNSGIGERGAHPRDRKGNERGLKRKRELEIGRNTWKKEKGV
jgi:hypothetical protein